MHQAIHFGLLLGHKAHLMDVYDHLNKIKKWRRVQKPKVHAVSLNV
jgi:hypothetical protein